MAVDALTSAQLGAGLVFNSEELLSVRVRRILRLDRHVVLSVRCKMAYVC